MAFPTKKEWTKRLQAVADKVSEARQELEQFAAECREEFDERSEKWQEGEKGQAWSELLDEMDEKACELEDYEGYAPDRPE